MKSGRKWGQVESELTAQEIQLFVGKLQMALINVLKTLNILCNFNFYKFEKKIYL